MKAKRANLWVVAIGFCVLTVFPARRALSAVEAPAVTVQRLRCEYLENPLGIEAMAPRLSWILEDGGKGLRGIRQTAYRVIVASSEALVRQNTGDLWDSGKVPSDQTTFVVYGGKPLKSRQVCYWKVHAWITSGFAGKSSPAADSSAWSDVARWEMGLLGREEWSAQWIDASGRFEDGGDPWSAAKWIWFPEPGIDLNQGAPSGNRYFRRQVSIPAGAKLESASLLMSVDDGYTLFVNGKEIGRKNDKDGWRRPDRYDLYGTLTGGDNVIAVQATNIAAQAGMCVKVAIRFAAGDPQVVTSDGQWKVASEAGAGWTRTGFDDGAWQSAVEMASMGHGVWGLVEESSVSAGVPLLRKSFALADKPVAGARLYVTALGLYEMHINGQRVGDILFAPEWTDYRKRIRYQVYDVTAMLTKGDNVLAGMIGHGWYSGHIGNGGYRHYGRVPALLAQMEVTYDDGTRDRVVTDASWKVAASPIISSDFMHGEVYDARAEVAGWDKPGLDGDGWANAVVREEAAVPLEAQVTQPVRQVREVRPKSVAQPKPGQWTFDMGQNMVGYVRVKVAAPAGTKLTIRHAEMLNPDGTIYTANLRGAPSIDTYICKGKGLEVFQPHFTFHGFRYVEVSGLSGKPAEDLVTGLVIASDTPMVGEFECSDARINQLYSNIQWGQIGNYLSVPTDCPQRDERLGWMGDAQVFVRTATYNADVGAFFTKWLVDVDDAQTPDGAFTDVSPRTSANHGTPAWADAGVICPWTIYCVYGDLQLLARHYPAMVRWIEWCRVHSTKLVRDKDRGGDYGDWLSIGADTPKDLIGTAYFAYSTRLVAQAAAALGKNDDASKYEKLFQEIRAAFNAKYVSAVGRIHGNTQCCYIMALKFDLLSDELRARALTYLEEDIVAKKDHLSTGFVGVSYLLPVLTQGGKTATAFKLFEQDSFPSWLFSVKHGATTIWERWDGWTPDRGFQNPGMNSFNHYSLGSCGEWMFSALAGIDTDGPGFKALTIRPTPGGTISWAKAGYDSIRGKIATSWKQDGSRFSLSVTIPVNATATVYVPATGAATVTESGRPAGQGAGVNFLRMEGGAAVYAVGSGRYSFESRTAGSL